jgi:hypothetical protein
MEVQQTTHDGRWNIHLDTLRIHMELVVLLIGCQMEDLEEAIQERMARMVGYGKE